LESDDDEEVLLEEVGEVGVEDIVKKKEKPKREGETNTAQPNLKETNSK
jgi:hypothetical protein